MAEQRIKALVGDEDGATIRRVVGIQVNVLETKALERLQNLFRVIAFLERGPAAGPPGFDRLDLLDSVFWWRLIEPDAHRQRLPAPRYRPLQIGTENGEATAASKGITQLARAEEDHFGYIGDREERALEEHVRMAANVWTLELFLLVVDVEP
jgi:hypothetical protein